MICEVDAYLGALLILIALVFALRSFNRVKDAVSQSEPVRTQTD